MSLASKEQEELPAEEEEQEEVQDEHAPLDDMTETTEQLQRNITEAAMVAPIYTIRLDEAVLEGEEPARGSSQARQSPAKSIPASAPKSPRRSSVAPADVSPFRRRATITSAIPARVFSPLRTDFSEVPSPAGSMRSRRSMGRLSLGSFASPDAFDAAPEADASQLVLMESNSVPVDIMNEEFDGTGDDSFLSNNDDAIPKGPMTLERFLTATGFELKPEVEEDITPDAGVVGRHGGEGSVRSNSRCRPHLLFLDPAPSIAYITTNSLEMPELEMLEFGCKELTQYIAKAKNDIDKLDVRASEDNPLLFLEFQEADKSERETILHNLEAAHTFSRLVAQEGWYTWKERLIDGFTSSVVDTREHFEKDAKFIGQFLEQLEVFLPEAKLYLDKLVANLEERKKR